MVNDGFNTAEATSGVFTIRTSLSILDTTPDAGEQVSPMVRR